ncbi:Retrotransposable element Tf2 protein [Ceratobasidium sp. AG-Ba]|nr:Retrotransposable element Tf2 protein [Ceratobasidium sp. AG-Ba]
MEQRHEKHYALKPLPIPAGPWEDTTYDFIVMLPNSKGYDRILTVVNCFSKMVHLIPCKPSSGAEDVAQMSLQHIWHLHGTSEHTASDRGPAFNVEYLRALHQALPNDPRFSTACHSQTNCQTEIKNKWVETYVRAFIHQKQMEWKDWLPLAEFVHNNARYEATGESPLEIIHGHTPVISLLLEPNDNPVGDDRAQALHATIQEVMPPQH